MQLKIVIAGPQGAGKSIIANFLSGHTEKLANATDANFRYDPTVGVRILELETRVKGINDSVNIELWDSSGDQRYENCWKATTHNADGVILIYNPDAPSQDHQLNDWFEFFVKGTGLREEQCLVMAHRTGFVGANAVNAAERFRPPPLFSRVSAALTTNTSEADIKTLFDNFLREIGSIKFKQAQQQGYRP